MRLFAACLSSLAGYVDAIGFIQTGGFFVSFMSGNSTRVGVGLVQGSENGLVAGGLILCFLFGIVAGSVSGHMAGKHRRTVVLILVSILLAAAACLDAVRAMPYAVAIMAIAMGAENAVFSEDGEVRIGLTYMTGTLVKLGQRLSETLFGGAPWGWAPYFLLWAGLLLGATTGAVAHHFLGLGALWGAVLAASAMAALAAFIGRDQGAQARAGAVAILAADRKPGR